MKLSKTAKDNDSISLGRAARIAGLVVFIPTAPYAEFYVYQKLIVYGSVEETIENIRTNGGLFVSGIFSSLFTFILDVILAWALSIFLRPVNKMVSLLTAWFRLVYGVVAVAILLNLVTVFYLASTPDFSSAFGEEQLQAQVLLSLSKYRSGFSIAFIIFSIYLGLLGYLVFISGYVPRVMGILLIIAGLGYLTTSLKPFLFPNYNLDFIMITYFGELIFTLWLLIKGSRIKPG